MNRKNFLKTCGFAGVGLLHACSATNMISGKLVADELLVPIAAFEVWNKGESYFKKYIVVQHPQLKYPICVYRLQDNEYSALWMRCTHQGTELQVFGEKLQCPAHGSEFDMQGQVDTGPATDQLRKFPITLEPHQLRISLKAI